MPKNIYGVTKDAAEIDRLYVNEKARRELGWKPLYDFAYVLKQFQAGMGLQSPLAKGYGVKRYHESE